MMNRRSTDRFMSIEKSALLLVLISLSVLIGLTMFTIIFHQLWEADLLIWIGALLVAFNFLIGAARNFMNIRFIRKQSE